MPIRITLADGPEAGRVFEFPDTQAVVTVGRHPSCDVVFAPDAIQVSRYHLAFERKLARYRLVMQADNPVWIDGEEAFEGDELPVAALVSLGGPKGPRLQVETIEDDDLPVTQRYARHDSAARLAATAARRVQTGLGALAFLVVAVALILGWMRHADRQDMTALLAQARQDGGAQAEEQLAARLREASRSVYLVAAKDDQGLTPFGTAFAVEGGALVTSAHVAEQFNDMGEGLTLVVRAAGAPVRDLRVARTSMHPQYRRFEDAWKAYGPLAAGAGGTNRPIVGAGGYDVAVLHLDPADAAALAPPLPLAADADLMALEPGDPVGYVGFPIESAALGGVNLDDPEAQLQIGRLTALTDFFLVKSDLADRQLLQHSLPVQGGASGSPLLDRRGQVIGVVSGGNLVEINAQGTRVPTGIGVNFAQRADLVREVLAGDADRRLAEREALWQRRLKRYQNEVDVALSDWVGSHGLSSVPPALEQVDGRTEENPRYDMPAFIHAFSVPKAGWYLFIATSRSRENIDMMLIEDTAKGPKLVGLDTSPDHYPGVEFAGEAGNELQVVIPGPAGTDVRLRVYYLPAGRR
ncbi:MAG: trypsin-like peptidase domain-containing protein [Magnetospirillum sp.]|nr:trypsin-like peptidase domain-containing protein [Magnetospirillum sp.]